MDECRRRVAWDGGGGWSDEERSSLNISISLLDSTECIGHTMTAFPKFPVEHISFRGFKYDHVLADLQND